MTTTPFFQRFLWLRLLPLSSLASPQSSHSGPLFTFCSPGSKLQEASKASLTLKETTPGGWKKDHLGEAGTGGGQLFPTSSKELQACLAGG